MAEKLNYYPKLVTKNNDKPNKLLSFPFVGIIIKAILIIPVGLWIVLLTFVTLFYSIILPFYILFTGKYWDPAYRYFMGYMKLTTKVMLYLTGLIDKYPGFGLDDGGFFELHFAKPQKVNRWLALPIFGAIIRIVILIPFLIWESIISYGLQASVFASWFAVLFTKKYPQSLYEFTHDYIRLSLASTVYSIYLSDTYPSFSISWNHKNVKIALIIIGILLMLSDMSSDYNDMKNESNKNNYEFTMPTVNSDRASF